MSRTERDAGLLGYAGVIPFAVGAALAWIAPSDAVLSWTLAYGTIILSFMGGARWSLALLSGGRTGTPLSSLLTAVTPALVGWAALVPSRLLAVPDWLRLTLLGVAFLVLLAEDRRGVRLGEAPGWYGALRTRLTVCVLIALAAILPRVA